MNDRMNQSVYKSIHPFIIHISLHLPIHLSVADHHYSHILHNPRHFKLLVLQGSVEGGVVGGAGVCIKPPPHLSALIAPPLPSLRCRGEEGSNYSGVSVAGCDSSPGKGRRASITHRPATG